MAKQLLMTPKAINDRKRLEAKKNGTYQPRQLSQSKDNLRKRAKYMEKKNAEAVDFGSVVNTEPLKGPEMLIPVQDLDKLTRSELRKLVLESRKSIPIQLKLRDKSDPNVTQILHTDLAKLIADKQALREATEKIRELTAAFESLKSANGLIVAAKNEKDAEIALLKSEIQTARRQRDDANAHSGIVTKKLEDANAFIEKMNESRTSIDKKVSELDIGMGKLNQIALRWKATFLSVLFVVAVPAVLTASAAVYLLTHQ